MSAIRALLLKNCHNIEETKMYLIRESDSTAKALIQLSWDSALLLKNCHNKEETKNVFKSVNLTL